MFIEISIKHISNRPEMVLLRVVSRQRRCNVAIKIRLSRY